MTVAGGFQDTDDVYIQPQKARGILPRVVRLLNGATANMNVNGSVTPVDFSFTPAAGETWYLDSLVLFFDDGGTNEPNTFGDLAALTNGVLITCTSLGVSHDIVTLKDNADIAHAFPVSSQSGTPNDTFLDSKEFWAGVFSFPHPIVLSGTSDSIRVRIRDNLTTIDHIRMSLHKWRVNG